MCNNEYGTCYEIYNENRPKPRYPTTGCISPSSPNRKREISFGETFAYNIYTTRFSFSIIICGHINQNIRIKSVFFFDDIKMKLTRTPPVPRTYAKETEGRRLHTRTHRYTNPFFFFCFL